MTRAFEALANIACAYGAKRPVWNGTEQVAVCWIERAEWLLKSIKDGLDPTAAIEEADRYSGRI